MIFYNKIRRIIATPADPNEKYDHDKYWKEYKSRCDLITMDEYTNMGLTPDEHTNEDIEDHIMKHCTECCEWVYDKEKILSDITLCPTCDYAYEDFRV